MKKKYALSFWNNFCRSMWRFCAAGGCYCFDVLAFSSQSSLISVRIHKHSKCNRTFSHRGLVFCTLRATTIFKGPASAEAASEENLVILGKYCPKFILKGGSRVHYSQISGSISKCLFWQLHCTNPCTKFGLAVYLPSFLFSVFSFSKVCGCEVESYRVRNARLAPTNESLFCVEWYLK